MAPLPPTSSTLPEGSTVAEALARGVLELAALLQVLLTGSYSSVLPTGAVPLGRTPTTILSEGSSTLM